MLNIINEVVVSTNWNTSKIYSNLCNNFIEKFNIIKNLNNDGNELI
jgi:hypothetical protein